MPPKPKTNNNHRSLLPIIFIAVAVIAIYLLWSVMLVFILAAFFAFIIHPIVNFFDRKMPRIFSIVTVYLLILIIFILIVGLLAPVVSRQTGELMENLPMYAEQTAEAVETMRGRFPERWESLIDRALIEFQEFAIRLAQETIPAFITFLTGLFALIFVPLLAFFMLLDYKGYKQMLIAVTPRRHRQTVDDLLLCTGKVMWNFIKGRLILMLVVGFSTGFGLYLVGMPYAVVFGIIAGLLELIPNVGPTITAILVGIIALMINPILAIQAIAVTIIVQILENIFLSPLIMAKAVGINPVTVILALFLGGSAAGILGALIAIPLAMMIKIVVLYFYVKDDELPMGKHRICRANKRAAKR